MNKTSASNMDNMEINFIDYKPNDIDKKTKQFNNLTLTIGFSVAILASGILIIMLLHQGQTSKVKIDIKDIAAVFTGIIVTTTCVYHAMNLNLNLSAHTLKLKLDVDKWNYDIQQKRLEAEAALKKREEETKAIKRLLTSERCLEWHRNSYNTGKSRAFIFKHKLLLNTYQINGFVEEIEKEENIEYRSAVIFVMNYFENLAEGILKEVLDEEIVKDIFKTMFIKYLDNLKPYIDHLEKREGEAGIYKSFKKVAESWK